MFFRGWNTDWAMLVLGLYQYVSEPSQKRLSKATSVMPHGRNAIYYFNFLEKKKLNACKTKLKDPHRNDLPLHP